VLAVGRHNERTLTARRTPNAKPAAASMIPSKGAASVSLPTPRRSVGRSEVTTVTCHLYVVTPAPARTANTANMTKPVSTVGSFESARET
jgi:hypothetical protein